jgi:hypothetical protein
MLYGQNAPPEKEEAAEARQEGAGARRCAAADTGSTLGELMARRQGPRPN